jgi:DNA polymerase-3 subunit alpha
MYLNCKTYFSYRYGVLSTEVLVKEAAERGVPALALTNINSTADHWDFMDFCGRQGIKPILGVEIRNEDVLCYIILAKNLSGIRTINRFLSQHLHIKKPFPKKPELDESVWIIYPLATDESSLQTNELIGILPSETNKLFGRKCAPQKYVIRHSVTFLDKKGHNLHRLLRAIHKNIILSKQVQEDTAAPDELFLTPAELLAHFRQYPFIVTNTLRLMDSCSYEFEFGTDKNKKNFSATPEDDRILLQKLAREGMYNRYGKNNREAHERVLKELRIIDQLGFNAYFLITWDIIRYAQSRGFYHVGRGSGANSIVAYCLEITDVNPIDLDLYFERFLNPHRTSPPDFDIDFSWKDRDEVIDYIFKRYGSNHVALLGMYSTFQFNASVRELGKVFGLPKNEIDALLNTRHAKFSEDHIQKQIIYYAAQMQNFPNYLSIHPGGMLIAEQSIHSYTATEIPPKGFTTAQIDMFVAEKIGLYKLDILSQRGLGHIKDACAIIRQNRGISINIHDVEAFKKDKAVAAELVKANTIGCFYIESPAMRQLLTKLRCGDYLSLVAASSIIRPGVAQSGMMREYIYRFHHPDKFEYLHPKMEELLKETYGVMVYQEDVIKIAHHFGGLDMGEADVLRRAMSGKYRSHNRFQLMKETFFTNCRAKGYPENLTAEVWRQMESFAGYSFSKAHSASFAVESYQSLFLKTHYPAEFMVAVINNFGGFYSTELYFHELRRTGADVHAPCVNNSDELTNIRGNDVYIGLGLIQNLKKDTLESLLKQRSLSGNFLSLPDFMERTGAEREQLTLLIRAGALRFTGKDKKSLLWEAAMLAKKMTPVPGGQTLFRETITTFNLPELHYDPYEDAMDEIEILGFPLCDPFSLVDADPALFITSDKFHQYSGQTIDILGYYITTKPVISIKSEFMFFGTFLDSQGNWMDTVHFPQSADRYPLSGKGFYHMRGKVMEEFGVYSVDVQWMKKTGLRGPAFKDN